MSLPAPSTVLQAVIATAAIAIAMTDNAWTSFFAMITPPSPKSTHVDEMTRDGSGRRHRRTDQMGAPTRTLATLEIAIRRGCAALARTEPIVVHAQAHRTARLAPFKTRGDEHAIESFALGLRLDEPRAGNHEHL